MTNRIKPGKESKHKLVGQVERRANLLWRLDENVSGGEIAMNETSTFEVRHPATDLRAKIQQRLRSQILLVVAHVIQEATQRHQLRWEEIEKRRSTSVKFGDFECYHRVCQIV